MSDAASEVDSLTRGGTRESLDGDRKLMLALVQLVQIIGEAAGRIPRETRDKYPSLPWAEIIGMRNRLIHGYDTIDLDILWQVVSVDIPPLVCELQRVIAIESTSPPAQTR
jgi:uncharacterized protein with HEPN domain